MISREIMSELERQAFENALSRHLRQSTEERASKIWTLSRNNLVMWQIAIVILILVGANYVEKDRLKGKEEYDLESCSQGLKSWSLSYIIVVFFRYCIAIY